MAILALFSIFYILFYSWSILRLCYGYSKIQTFVANKSEPEVRFSIIIPFRNEEQNLPRLLSSIESLNYPRDKFELIFVNDASEDSSVNVINKWRMQNGLFQTTLLDNIRVSKSPKKDAITRAVGIVAMDWIITTDADAVPGADWLATYNAYIQTHNPEMIAGPVAYEESNTFLSHFQAMDSLSLQGATIGSFGINNAFMCNGANFAYRKTVFAEFSGFSGNTSVASGDDVFLLQKVFTRKPDAVHYLKAKAAIVQTKPACTWFELVQQRIRWASKATTYQSDYGTQLALAVFFGNLSLVVVAIVTLLGKSNVGLLAVLFLLKSLPDLVLLIQANRFFRNGRLFFPVVSLLFYPFFSVVVAIAALFGRYQWKGRKYTH